MAKFQLLLVILLTTLFVSGQETTIKEELIELGIPSYPAITLMGILPQEITRPKSLNQLEATLINSFVQEGNFSIPRNFALEVMPYWLKSHPFKEFSYEGFSKNEFAPLENFALSLGTVNESFGDSVFNTKVGFGARTLILSGKVEKEKLDSIDKLVKQFHFLSYSNTTLIAVLFTVQDENFETYNDFFSKIELEMRNSMAGQEPAIVEDEISKAKEFFKEFIPEDEWNTQVTDARPTITLAGDMLTQLDKKMNDKEFTELAARIQKVQARKTGIFWEVAASTYLDFPNGNMNFSTIPKFGIWSTASYTLSGSDFGAMATIRYIRDFGTETNTSNLDYGGGLFYQTHKITFAAEFLQRYQTTTIERTTDEDGYELHTTKSRYEYRSTLNVSYRLSHSIVVAYTFGKTFGVTDNRSTNIVNQLSLNFGLGMVPLKL
jgi:hypothetical protein